MSDLEAQIKNWLNEQGYPLEMRVARAFRQAGFHVLQSDYYEDPTTAKQREIDVVATVSKKFGKYLFRLQFVVECKMSKGKPWILFCGTNQRIASPARIVQRAASDVGRSVLFDLAQREDIQNLDLFEVTSPAAYGITQALTNSADVTYTALTNVTAAASSIIEESNDYHFTVSPFATVVFPLIVTEGKLFTAILQDDASISLNEVQQGTLLWRNRVVGEPHTIVNIVADAAIENYAKGMFASAVSFFALCEKEFISAAQNWENNRPKNPIGRRIN